MKFLYIANIRLPTEKAHGAQIMKTCEALANEKIEVTLLVPRRHVSSKEDAFEYYNIAHNFKIVRLPTIDIFASTSFGFRVQSMIFSVASLIYWTTHTFDIVFSRDEIPLWCISIFTTKYIWESHTAGWNTYAQRVAKRAYALVAISNGIKNFYKKKGIQTKKIIVIHDAVDLRTFMVAQDTISARVRLGLPLNRKIVLYIGRLDGWKGVETLFESAKHLPHDILVCAIGGEPKQIEDYTVRYPFIHFVGYRPYSEVADNEAAADVLVLPNTASNEISARFTSPMKLFTYMASGKPIVASDLPSIREVLDEHSALFVIPDNPHALAQGIQFVLANKAHAKKIAARAQQIVQKYTWEARAQAIIGAAYKK